MKEQIDYIKKRVEKFGNVSITAAPDMLSALKQVEYCITNNHKISDLTLSDIRSAIEKAQS